MERKPRGLVSPPVGGGCEAAVSKTGIKEGQPDPEPLVRSEGPGVDIAQFPRADSGNGASWKKSGEKSHEEKRRRARR